MEGGGGKFSVSEARRVRPVPRGSESAAGKWLWSLKCSGEIHGRCIQTKKTDLKVMTRHRLLISLEMKWKHLQ